MGTKASGSQQPNRRISKACEPCRSRRRKCDGGRPCGTCQRAGTPESCQIRVKARPKRPLPSSILPRSEEDITSDLVSLVEQYLRCWLRKRDEEVDLGLPEGNASIPGSVVFQNLPTLPGTTFQRKETFETFLTCFKHHISMLSPGRAPALIEAFNSRSETLPSDEWALAVSFLALGKHFERDLAKSGDTAEDEGLSDDTICFLLALRALDDWNQVSASSLAALHMLHFFVILKRGGHDLRAILNRMTTQCRQLGLHRRETAQMYPPEDDLGRLFYLSLYKETWFCTLSGQIPTLRVGDFEQTWSDPPSNEIENRFEEHPIFMRLTLLENEAIQVIGSHWKLDDLSSILDIEEGLAQWQCAIREPKNKPPKVIVLTWAMIRYHWLRLVLRFPLLQLKTQTLASLATIARSATAIIQTYHQFASSMYFTPRWAETRRITTAAYSLYICWIEGEVALNELKPIAALALDLLERSAKRYEPTKQVLRAWKKLMCLAGIEANKPVLTDVDEENRLTEESQSPVFDFTLPY